MDSNWQKLILLGIGAALFVLILSGVPSFAQYTNGVSEQSLSQKIPDAMTIGPKTSDATVIQGVNTSGTVRVNMLACLEALINIVANGTQVVGIIWASIILVTVKRCMKNSSRQAKIRLVVGLVIFAFSLSIPEVINWLVATARDANLYS